MGPGWGREFLLVFRSFPWVSLLQPKEAFCEVRDIFLNYTSF
jgi:hypothetical protein